MKFIPKLIPKLIIWLTRLEEKKIATFRGNKPTHIYCHRNEKGEVVGLLFKNPEEQFTGLIIEGRGVSKPFGNMGSVQAQKDL